MRGRVMETTRIAFTGHRPNKLGGYAPNNPTKLKLKEKIKEVLSKRCPDMVMSGMALGVDQWAVEVCIDLDIPFIAAIPFYGQESMWPKESKDYYLMLLDKATEIIHVCDPGYAAWKMQKRNKYMVDWCDTLVAIFDGTEGGTKNCVDYAKSTSKEIIHIDPRKV